MHSSQGYRRIAKYQSCISFLSSLGKVFLYLSRSVFSTTPELLCSSKSTINLPQSIEACSGSCDDRACNTNCWLSQKLPAAASALLFDVPFLKSFSPSSSMCCTRLRREAVAHTLSFLFSWKNDPCRRRRFPRSLAALQNVC